MNGTMNFETFSILTGTEACNARCPFCVAKLSPTFEGVNDKKIHWRNFNKGAQLARDARVSTVIITSYGEPTLFPKEISAYLSELIPYKFPIIELQTNAVVFELFKEKYTDYLKKWYELGLDIIAISIVHYDKEINRECYMPRKEKYIDLQGVIQQLKDIGFSVRLNCTLAKGWMDSAEKLHHLIKFSKQCGAFQLTVRPVNTPFDSRNKGVSTWVKDHLLEETQVQEFKDYLRNNGVVLLKKPYGAIIYDIKGYNVCMTNCFTLDENQDNMRQLIFFPNGALRYDWQYNAVLLAPPN